MYYKIALRFLKVLDGDIMRLQGKLEISQVFWVLWVSWVPWGFRVFGIIFWIFLNQKGNLTKTFIYDWPTHFSFQRTLQGYYKGYYNYFYWTSICLKWHSLEPHYHGVVKVTKLSYALKTRASDEWQLSCSILLVKWNVISPRDTSHFCTHLGPRQLNQMVPGSITSHQGDLPNLLSQLPKLGIFCYQVLQIIFL